ILDVHNLYGPEDGRLVGRGLRLLLCRRLGLCSLRLRQCKRRACERTNNAGLCRDSHGHSFFWLESFPSGSAVRTPLAVKPGQRLILVWPFGDTNAAADCVVAAAGSGWLIFLTLPATPRTFFCSW